jgi:hypothetical protein
MHESIKDLIDVIIDENPVESEKLFNNILNDKLVDRIDTYRQEVANMFFNSETVAEENSSADVGFGEHGDGEYPAPQMDMWAGEETTEETPEETPEDSEETPE